MAKWIVHDGRKLHLQPAHKGLPLAKKLPQLTMQHVMHSAHADCLLLRQLELLLLRHHSCQPLSRSLKTSGGE